MKKRTDIDFTKHEVITTESDGLLIHYLKKPNTIHDSIKYINPFSHFSKHRYSRIKLKIWNG